MRVNLHTNFSLSSESRTLPGSVKRTKTDCELPSTYSSIGRRSRRDVLGGILQSLPLHSIASESHDDSPDILPLSNLLASSGGFDSSVRWGDITDGSSVLELDVVDSDEQYVEAPVWSVLETCNRLRCVTSHLGKTEDDQRPVSWANSSSVTNTDRRRTPSGRWSTAITISPRSHGNITDLTTSNDYLNRFPAMWLHIMTLTWIK